MKIEQSGPDTIRIDCMKCGAMFEVPDYRRDSMAEILDQMYREKRYCPACNAAREEEEEQQIWLSRLPMLVAQAGIPEHYSHDRATGELFRTPPVEFAAKWIMDHRDRNLLISGITGCGKSTSACFVAARELAEHHQCRYVKLRKLLAEWREAKTSDTSYASEKLLTEIFRQDLYIIDEFVGKARITESGQELLFEILEAVNSGECQARMWLLGNFYAGSIEQIFNDPDPLRRRLQENFVCAVIDREKQTVNPINVWR